jgi:TP901 family phage tail tape measure protein
MAVNVGTAYVVIAPAFARDFNRQIRDRMRDAEGGAGQGGRDVARAWHQNLSRGLDRGGKALTVGLTAPLVAAGTAAFAMSREFSKGLANIATLIPGSTERVKELGRGIQDLAILTGKSTDDLSDGMYNVISAFGDTADSMSILETNAKAARAGLADTSDAINLTSGITKAYGDTTKEAVAQAADLALMTVRLGQTTFPELAASMGKVVPLAQSMGQSQEELFAVFATLTGVTGGASEVATQYRSALQALAKPTGDMSGLLSELGYESGQALLEQEGLLGTFDLVAKASKETGTPLASYWGSIEAVTAALALGGPQADNYRAKLKELQGAAGATDVAFGEATQGVDAAGFAMDQAKQRGIVFMQQLGDGLAPVVLSLFDAFQPFMEKLLELVGAYGELEPGTQKLVLAFVALAAAIGPAMLIAAKLVGVYTAMVTVGTPLNKVLKALAVAFKALGRAMFANPIGLIVLALIAVGVALFLAYKKFEGFRNVVDKVFKEVGRIAQMLWRDYIQPALVAIGAAIVWLWQKVVKPYIGFVGRLMLWLWDKAIKPAAKFIWGAIKVIGAIVGWLWRNAFKPAFQGIGIIVGVLWRIIKPIAKFIWIALQDVGKIIGWLWNTVAKPYFRAIGRIVMWLWTNAVKPMWEKVKPIFVSIGRLVAELWRKWKTNMGTIITKVKEWAGKVVAIFVGIKDGIGKAWDAIGPIVLAPVNFLIDPVYAKLRELFNKGMEAMGLKTRLPGISKIGQKASTNKSKSNRGGLVAFSDGGVLPGYQPGRDSVLAMLSQGEGVLRPEVVRALGASTINAWNAAGKAGTLQKFADGGVVGAAKGGAARILADLVSKGSEKFLSAPVEALLRKLPGDGMMKEIAKGAASKLLEGAVSKLVPPSMDGAAPLTAEQRERLAAGGVPSGYQQMFHWIKSLVPGARLTSGLRAGDWGYHGMGRATDLAFSDRSEFTGSGQARLAFTLIKTAFKPLIKELIWDFAGSKAVWMGRDHFFTGPSAGPGSHADHIHWAMDQGGMLPPNSTRLISNFTNGPEPVLTTPQWSAVTDLIDAVASGGGTPDVTVYIDGKEYVGDMVRVEVDKSQGRLLASASRGRGLR